MPVYPTLDSFVLACRETQLVADLWQICLQFYAERRIVRVSYHGDAAPNQSLGGLTIAAEGFPAAWVCQYLERRLYLIDPIPQLAAVSARPFQWSETPMLTKLTDEGADYMRMLLGAGLGDGIAMQVHGPAMRNAYVGLGFGETDPSLTAAEIFELQCAAQISHIRYCELTEDRLQGAEPLSPREIEVLRWIARGKSTSVIADILGVSRHTVDTITRRIFSKLDVNDRTTAAVRGIGSGLLQHRDGNVL